MSPHNANCGALIECPQKAAMFGAAAPDGPSPGASSASASLPSSSSSASFSPSSLLFAANSLALPSAPSVMLPSSVIVPSASEHPNLGPSVSLPLVDPQQSTMFPVGSLSNLIAQLNSLSQHRHPLLSPPLQHSVLADLFQQQQQSANTAAAASLAERVRQSACPASSSSSSSSSITTTTASSSSASSSSLPFQMDSSNSTIGLQNGTLPDPQTTAAVAQQLLASLAQPPQSAPVPLSAVEVLQKALETIAVANQQQSKLFTQHNPISAAIFAQPQYLLNGSTADSGQSLLGHQLLTLLALQQHQPQHLINSKPSPYLVGFQPLLNCGGTTTHSQQGQHQQTSAAEPHPMDLNPSQLRPFENGTNNVPPQQQMPPIRKNCDIRRSASSVSYKGSADVSEHFQRTFSGKWPRRQPSLRAHLLPATARGSKSGGKEGAIGESAAEGDAEPETVMAMAQRAEETVNRGGAEERTKTAEEQKQPQQRPKSRQHARQVYSTIVRKLFTSEDKQVEDHFRKSLGQDRFQQIKNAQHRQDTNTTPMTVESTTLQP